MCQRRMSSSSWSRWSLITKSRVTSIRLTSSWNVVTGNCILFLCISLCSFILYIISVLGLWLNFCVDKLYDLLFRSKGMRKYTAIDKWNTQLKSLHQTISNRVCWEKKELLWYKNRVVLVCTLLLLSYKKQQAGVFCILVVYCGDYLCSQFYLRGILSHSLGVMMLPFWYNPC